jgi:hypothetical protein
VGHSQHNIESHLFLGGRFCIAGSKQEFWVFVYLSIYSQLSRFI